MRFVVNLVHAMGSAAISESQNHVERLSHHPVMKDIERPDVFLSHSCFLMESNRCLILNGVAQAPTIEMDAMKRFNRFFPIY